jgi:PDZ domain-containing protein
MTNFLKNYFNKLKNGSLKYKIGFILVLLLYVITIGLCLISINVVSETDYISLSPGGVSSVSSVIEVDTDHEAGDIYTISVYEYRRLTLLQYFISKNEKDIRVDEDSQEFLTDEQLHTQGTIMKDTSITNSLIVAYEEAKKKNDKINIDYVFKGIIIHTIYEYTDKSIKQKDIITHVNGKQFTNYEEYSTLIKEATVNDTIKLTVLRENEHVDIDVKVNVFETKDDDGKVVIKRLIGISGYPHYKIISATPSFTIHDAKSTGPSGGLMQTIAIYNALTAGDITEGLKIMGTGTIEVDGKVGAIGGVEQKMLTANIYKADYVFVPSDNYEDAIKQYNLIKNPSFPTPIKIDNFSEAIAFLESIGK